MLNLVANGSSGYNLTNSLRFRSSASAYLNRTLGTPTDGKIWTWSGWVKRGALGSGLYGIQHGFSATNNQGGIYFQSDALVIADYPTSLNCNVVTTQVFRDPSAWYHIVIAVDTTQATASNRVKFYVNGLQITTFSTATYPTQNTTFRMVASGNNGSVGRYYDGTSYYFDGYLTEVNFIDGQALTPSSFGSTNSLTGVWQPAKYTGTYGTNGFYLNFNSIALTSGSNTGLGKDNSGNGNYWNTNNISVTAGTTYDAMTDVPTNTSATVANYAVLNPLKKGSCFTTLNNGNLYFLSTTSPNYGSILATMGMASGKYYWEITVATATTEIGIALDSIDPETYFSIGTAGWCYNADGTKRTNNTDTSYGASFTTGDVIGVAFDATNGSLTFYKNGSSQGVAFSSLASNTYFPAVADYTGGGTAGGYANFGQQPFSYTPPTGFVRLNTYNLPTPTILQGNTQMNAVLQTGNFVNTGANLFAQSGYTYGLVWGKDRTSVNNHQLVDTLRGTTNVLATNSSANETTYTAPTSTDNCVAWTWNANTASASNTNGSTTSSVQVNTTAGFSIVSWTGNGSNATVGHGLGITPKMLTLRPRTVTGGADWPVYHANLTSAQYVVFLNNTNAQTSYPTIFNSTAPTSSVLSVGSGYNINAAPMIAYVWAEIAGFSKFINYTGNGSTDGVFIYTGFRPKYVMVKRTDSTGEWNILDSARNTYNVMGQLLWSDSSAAEATYNTCDFLSNGIKMRGTASDTNASGGSYIIACFAENPFKNALAR